MARVTVIESVEKMFPNKWTLCFQKVSYNYDKGKPENGYRFIWKTNKGNLQPARGQARIPDSETLITLLENAKSEGWFNSQGQK